MPSPSLQGCIHGGFRNRTLTRAQSEREQREKMLYCAFARTEQPFIYEKYAHNATPPHSNQTDLKTATDPSTSLMQPNHGIVAAYI